MTARRRIENATAQRQIDDRGTVVVHALSSWVADDGDRYVEIRAYRWLPRSGCRGDTRGVSSSATARPIGTALARVLELDDPAPAIACIVDVLEQIDADDRKEA